MTGATFRTVATGFPANSIGLLAVGVGTTNVSLASLVPQGLPGCALFVQPLVLQTMLPNGGTATSALALPDCGGTRRLLAAIQGPDAIGSSCLDGSGALAVRPPLHRLSCQRGPARPELIPDLPVGGPDRGFLERTEQRTDSIVCPAVDQSLYATWRPRLLSFCRQLLRHHHDAEEVVQDVFTKLLTKANRYDLAVDVGVLLFRLARNRCIDLRRKHRPAAIADLVVAAPAVGHRPEVDEAIAALPLPEREVLVLTTIDGLGYREVAAILGCSLGTVAARKYAAIDELRRRLAP